MGYCAECGRWQPLDDTAKLCRPCWDAWPHRATSRPAGNPPIPEGAR